ncbi:unnamed protein product [Paramecium sonneborni]|uniref:Protein kinase domain-containing protein n=1 Tax=Paramecium sonneborni TaxID=65129 RepID=A0A8S1QU38_9CILI|nr:unnamed protein product [Paramecium sonneborni]
MGNTPLQNSQIREQHKECESQEYEKIINLQKQLAQDGDNKKYILGIESYTRMKNNYVINYNGSKDSISLFEYLRQLNQQVDREKIDIKFKLFYQLLKIAEFLQEKEIIHNNIKPTNIIFNNNQLYLTDFGYLKSEQSPTKFSDDQNLKKTLLKDQRRYIYPYYNTETLQNIIQNKIRQEEDVKKKDQYALTVMMLEIFCPFDEKIDYKQQKCIELSTMDNRKKQIQSISKCHNNILTKEEIQTIQYILENRLQYQLNSFSNELISEYEIKKEQFISQKIIDQYLKLIENEETEFDMKILYLFSEDELKHKLNLIQKQQNIDNGQFLQKFKDQRTQLNDIKKKIKNIELQNLFDQNNQSIDNQISPEIILREFFVLLQLDQQIQELKINDAQIINKLKLVSLCDFKKKQQFQYVKFKNLLKDQLPFDKLFQVKQTLNNNQDQSCQNQTEENKFQEQKTMEYLYTFKLKQNYQQAPQDLFDKLPNNILKDYLKTLYIQNFPLNDKFPSKVYIKKGQPNNLYIGWFNEKQQFQGQLIKEQVVQDNNQIQTNSRFHKLISCIKSKQPSQNQQILIKHYFNIQIDNLHSSNSGQSSLINTIPSRKSKVQEIEVIKFQTKRKIREYYGNIEKNEYHGQGLLQDYQDNLIYDGNWKIGEFEKGSQIIREKDLQIINDHVEIKGTFRNWQPHGNNIMTYINDEHICIGEYKNGIMVGQHDHYKKEKKDKWINYQKADEKDDDLKIWKNNNKKYYSVSKRFTIFDNIF